ncbi:molecular chaperone [Calothrix sp. UHCC 0171]|uniref:fimbrial biogenesis chaperone n=1 Tax=Calothrix sp. UHCC 0171 TaxID=3110245 RepID=UPI002B1F7085|nr:fimbria/pilus periplasmic chaperone [Calothrix sp. UHCC 0171]MEA5572759.1 fimbria/pilus periplasmic chaperone [Calothrix sp. UHCC 0171]
MLQKTKIIALSLLGAFTQGLLWNLALAPATALEIGVSPPKFEVEMNGKGRSQSIKITNFSAEPVEMQAYVRNWTLNEENKLQEIQSTENSLDQWIVFTPARFTIPPRSSQSLRFAIRPKVQPQEGEHRAVIYLEEVLPQSKENSQSVVTIGRVGIVVYGYAGKIKRAGTLNSINVDAKANSVNAIFDISSTGNANVRMKGQYSIWRAANYPGAKATQPISGISGAASANVKLPANVVDAGILRDTPVLASTRRKLVMPIKKLPPGNYVLDINGDLNGVAVDQGIPFTVPATGTTPAAKNPVIPLRK